MRLVATLLMSSLLAADMPSFETASVKHSDPKGRTSGANTCTGGPGTSDPGMLHCTNSSLALLIIQAYNVKWYELISPKLGNSRRKRIRLRCHCQDSTRHLQAGLPADAATPPRRPLSSHRPS